MRRKILVFMAVMFWIVSVAVTFVPTKMDSETNIVSSGNFEKTRGFATRGLTTISVKIHRIQKVDPIEGLLSGEADWYYHVGKSEWDGTGWYHVWQHSSEPIVSNDDDITIDQTHPFSISSTTVRIYIMLCEDDGGSGDDYADVSDDPQGGIDNWAGSIQPPSDPHKYYTGTYVGIYDIVTDTLTGNATEPGTGADAGYLKTSGDFDGSTGVDENDANVWFSVWDNYELPIADAGSDKTVYTGDLVNFNGGGSQASAGSSIDRYQWDFNNDGTFDAEGQTTSHTYNTKGTYTVTLKVTDNYEKTDTDICIITVMNRAPTAAFTYSPSNPTTADTIEFTDTSTDSDGTIASWSWKFGDGDTSTQQNPTHKYSDDGMYTVQLTVTDNDGGQDTESKTITVLNLDPTASFIYSPSSPTTIDTIQFTDTSTDPDGTIASWSWVFGDGYTSMQQNPTHKYAEANTYTVKLTVTDDDGGQDDKTVYITVTQAGGIIEGTVEDLSGNPLQGVTITVYTAGTTNVAGTAATDSDGRYRITSLSAGTYDVKAFKTGYEEDIQVSKSVTVDQTTTVNFILVLEGTTGSIAGTIKDSEGNPIEGVSITVYNAGTNTVIGTAITGSDGKYSITKLQPGDYDIKVSKSGYDDKTVPSQSVTTGSPMTINLILTPVERGGVLDFFLKAPYLGIVLVIVIIAIILILWFVIRKKKAIGKESTPKEEVGEPSEPSQEE